MNNSLTDYKQLSEDYLRVEQAIQYLENHYKDQPNLDEVAASIGLSEYHFQRMFTRWAGVSPKRFLQYLTKEGAKELLNQSENLLDTTYQIGLSSLGRLHDLFVTTEAITPGEYKSRGAGLTIRYGIHPTPFGKCLIGVTERGICHLGFVQTSEGDAIDALVADWKEAQMIEDHRSTAPLIAPIFDLNQTRENSVAPAFERNQLSAQSLGGIAQYSSWRCDHLRTHCLRSWQPESNQSSRHCSRT